MFAKPSILFQVRMFLNLLPSSEVDTETFTVDQPLEVGRCRGFKHAADLFLIVFDH